MTQAKSDMIYSHAYGYICWVYGPTQEGGISTSSQDNVPHYR
jgi:hypothetical protein